MKKGFALLFLVVALSVLVAPIRPISAAEAELTAPPLIIAEIKLGGDSFTAGIKDPQEFVAIYNPSDQEIPLVGWKLQYAKADAAKPTCDALAWSDTNIAAMTVPPKSTAFVERPMTDSSDGALRLLDADNAQRDLVGWGTVSCYEALSVARPSSGKSIKRYIDCVSLPIDTNNNAQDFAHNQTPSPRVFTSIAKSSCNAPEDPEELPDPVPQLSCEGIVINEILPNPSGSDKDHEYIELYNPTDELVSLEGCSLQTSASTKKYTFDDSSLQPGEYRAIGDTASGLTLTNASGGSVWLLSPEDAELQSVVYPGALDDNQAWGLFAGGWQATYEPTPGEDNVLLALKPCLSGQERSTETGLCRVIATSSPSNELTPCRPDQERNPETNRCRLIQLASASLVACGLGQERNPNTNRCRSISSVGSDLVPCKAGQERNPETNRCRSSASTASTLVPCDEGQERNPETNRCRKATAGSVAGIAAVKDIDSGPIASSPRWLLAGLGVVGALGYGLFEWRREVFSFASSLRSKLFRA